MNLTVCADVADIARHAADAFVEAVAAAGDRPAVCLSGGSTPQALHRLLASPVRRTGGLAAPARVLRGRAAGAAGDERSNYHAAAEALLDQVPVDPAKVYPLTDADAYEGLLRSFFGERPDFDRDRMPV